MAGLDSPSRAAAFGTTRGNLQGLDLFRGIDVGALEAYLEACSVRALSAGEVLLSPDENNDHLFAVLEGEVIVQLARDSQEPLVTIKAGACVGEMSFVDGERPSAYVVAAHSCLVLVIPHDTLWAMCNSAPLIARNLLALLAQRVR
ncbi:MAG: Crp/Fnr family transcriptional regulator, partial [Pseudomonadota bacterium]